MVLPMKVGKQRSFRRGLLLTIVTLGIYSFYWNFKAHREVFEQFELRREGRDDGIIWFILTFVVSIFLWVFQYKAIENLNYVRERSNMPVRLTPGTFLVWQIVPGAVAFVMFVPLVILLPLLAEGGDVGLIVTLVGAVVVLAIGAVIASAIGYHQYQTSLNEVWDRYDQRRAEIAAANPAPPAAPPIM